jgi:hypothetical protein
MPAVLPEKNHSHDDGDGHHDVIVDQDQGRNSDMIELEAIVNELDMRMSSILLETRQHCKQDKEPNDNDMLGLEVAIYYQDVEDDVSLSGDDSSLEEDSDEKVENVLPAAALSSFLLNNDGEGDDSTSTAASEDSCDSFFATSDSVKLAIAGGFHRRHRTARTPRRGGAPRLRKYKLNQNTEFVEMISLDNKNNVTIDVTASGSPLSTILCNVKPFQRPAILSPRCE